MAKVRKRTYSLTGQHIGSLTAVEPCIVNGYAGWKCICDCGVKCEKTTQQLRDVIKGKRKGISCGCNRNRTNGLIGKRFSRLVVVERASNHGLTKWACRCDCGGSCVALASELRSGHVKSCGCLEKENRETVWMRSNGGKTLTYGERSRRYNERLYNVWNGMKTRCYNPNNKRFKDYGGRGIVVCDEWKNDFSIFQKWALENGYDANAPFGQCTIDRIDVNGNYEPSNCRWITMAAQQKNKR